jgi:succinate dehydrogenase/fumarate reductase flavoprotein subunit
MKSQNYETKKCDLLVVGGGGSGAMAAVEASRHQSLKILIASRGPVSRSGLTPTGNGGTSAFNSAEEMFKVMVTAGDFLNDQRIIWFMTNEIQNSLQELRKLGVPVTPMGPKSVCVPGVETLTILRKELVKRPNVELLEDVMITRLIRDGERISVATALDLSTGKFLVIEFDAVIIATGGVAGELYPYTSNNPFGVSTDAAGTGHAMAYLAGAELIDLELIQFVPLPADPRCLNLRYFPDFWKGPYLNRHGEVVESHPGAYLGETYSHLFVQKMFREIEKGNGPIYVDQRNRSAGEWALPIKSWERRRRFIKSLGIDPHENRIELTIGSHFCMGGVRVNAKTETTIPGLYATGEVMGGVHGGLRLPGYSFAHMIVFGFEAGRQAANFAEEHQRIGGFPTEDIAREEKWVLGFLETKADSISLRELKKYLQKVMNDHVFVFRDQGGLEMAIDEIRAIKEKVCRVTVPGFKRFNLDWVRAIEFSSMVECAEIIAKSALFRKESRGSHYRRDFPQKDIEQKPMHTVVRFEGGHSKLYSAPVMLDRMKPEA